MHVCMNSKLDIDGTMEKLLNKCSQIEAAVGLVRNLEIQNDD